MSEAYNAIQNWYGDRVAKRSNIPLINHINEGLIVLDTIKAPDVTKDAFCLHPLFQVNNDLQVIFNSGYLNRFELSNSSVLLAMEYRTVANSWLSTDWDTKSTVDFGPLGTHIKDMLIADKIQNYKDFMLYHKSTHARAFELETYFQKWFLALGLSSFTVVDLIRKIQNET